MSGLYSAVSVLGYVIGIAIGVVIMRHDNAEHRPVRRALATELVCLSGLLVAWHLTGSHPAERTVVILVALAAIAMGIQSGAVLRLPAGPTTTYITGTLTTFTAEVARRLHLLELASTSTAAPHDQGTGHRSSGGAWMYGATWIVYLLAAVATGVVFLHLRELALLLPITTLVAVIAIETRASANRPCHGVLIAECEG
jgi:uncharacterized membrane protein YoaK (UPF0700 family)